MKIIFKNGSRLQSIKSKDNIRSFRADEMKEFYQKYPDIFLENYFDIKLLPYQKLWVRSLYKDNGKD